MLLLRQQSDLKSLQGLFYSQLFEFYINVFIYVRKEVILFLAKNKHMCSRLLEVRNESLPITGNS